MIPDIRETCKYKNRDLTFSKKYITIKVAVNVMPNYKFSDLHREFKEYFRKSRDKTTKCAWEFAQLKGIVAEASEALPSLNTIYRWHAEVTQR